VVELGFRTSTAFQYTFFVIVVDVITPSAEGARFIYIYAGGGGKKKKV
jgi:hypothetical protein